MLGGRMSTQEEQDVEDELADLEAQLSKPQASEPQKLPSVPSERLPEIPTDELRTDAEPVQRQAMLAE